MQEDIPPLIKENKVSESSVESKKIHEELDRLDNDFKKFINHFNKKQENTMKELETKMKASVMTLERPEVSHEVSSRDTESKAFAAYVRHGEGGIEGKALISGEVPGSYLVPAPVQERIIGGITQYASLRSVARHITISSSSLEVIADRNLPTTGWVTENQDRPYTQEGTLVKISIPLHEIYAKQRATQRLLDDGSVNIEEWLVSRINEKMIRFENQAFVNGDGQAKPRGFLSYETTSRDAWEWGKLEEIKTGTDGQFPARNPGDILVDLVESLPTDYLSGSVWVMSRSAHSEVRKLKSKETGQYLWQPSFGEKALGTLLGYPVLVMDEMPALVAEKASKSIAFGNFQEAYQIVDRGNVNVLRDPYSAKPYVEFYTTKRVGGDVINFEAIKILNFAA